MICHLGVYTTEIEQQHATMINDVNQIFSCSLHGRKRSAVLTFSWNMNDLNMAMAGLSSICRLFALQLLIASHKQFRGVWGMSPAFSSRVWGLVSWDSVYES